MFCKSCSYMYMAANFIELSAASFKCLSIFCKQILAWDTGPNALVNLSNQEAQRATIAHLRPIINL